MLRKLIVLLMMPALFFLTLATFVPAVAHAQVQNDLCHRSGGFLGFPTWYEYLEVENKELLDKDGNNIGSDECAIVGPKDPSNGEFSWEKALPRIVLAVIDIMLRLVGLVTVGFLIFGGFLFLTSQGEPEALKKGRGTILNAAIGLVIAILATTLVSFVGDTLWK